MVIIALEGLEEVGLEKCRLGLCLSTPRILSIPKILPTFSHALEWLRRFFLEIFGHLGQSPPCSLGF